MEISIRTESENDFREVENMVREAFWDIYKPGAAEHLVLHKLRKSPAFVPEFHLIACDDGKIVGNIAYSKAYIRNAGDERFEVLCMGPLSVLPDYQGKGIGGLLLRESIGRARQFGYRAIVIFGNPGYYRRFGFQDAGNFHIATSDGHNFDAFMVLDLSGNRLAGIEGRFFADPAFEVDEAELDEFDTSFPPKEKHVTDTQLK